MKIGVMGLGYVGIVNAACFAELGHDVVGCDIKSQKVHSVLEGKSPVHEPKIEALIKKNLEKGKLNATTSAKELVEFADIILICVGTPSDPSGAVNLSYTINTTMEIAELLSGTSKDLTIAYRSTIPPGSVEDKFRPLICKHLKDYSGKLTLAFYPEFLREGKAVDDFMNAPRIVIGAEEEELDLLMQLLDYNPNSPVIKTDTRTAEFVKYVDNAFHALKIAFANEIYSVGNEFEINIPLANEIFLQDRVLNISSAYLKPGMPFGGSCLPKDLRALESLSSSVNVSTPLLNSILPSNEGLKNRIINQIISFNKKNILLVGLTFKNFTDDVRESPMLDLAQYLIENNGYYKLTIYDEDVNLQNLRIEHADIVQYLTLDLESSMADAELIIVCKRYLKGVLSMARHDQIIYNLANNNKVESPAEVHNLFG